MLFKNVMTMIKSPSNTKIAGFAKYCIPPQKNFIILMTNPPMLMVTPNSYAHPPISLKSHPHRKPILTPLNNSPHYHINTFLFELF